MELSDQFGRNRSFYSWIKVVAAGLLAAAVAGCGGSGGSGDTAAAAPAAGAGTTVAGVTAPTGTAPVTLSTLTAEQMAALTPVVTVGGVSIASPPQVTFAISDGAATNNPIIGFGASSQSATAITPTLTYLRFAMAKLVPGTNGAPSKWVSYIVTTNPAYTSATDKTIVPGTATRPTTENNGTLVDNKNGTYTYTFARDITKIKGEVAAMTLTGVNVAADLGDLTYDPSLPHRLAIQLSGGGMENPVNAIYDFIPATGKAIAAADLQREVVAIANCNECHGKLAFHGGGRIDTKFCVVCHTDQRKYGRTNVASTAGAFPALVEKAVVNSTTGITSYYYSKNTTTTSSSYHPTGTLDTYVADGEVAGDFPTMIHKIHQGTELVKQNYNYANVAFNNKGFSMLGGGQRMCAKCHDNTKAVNADNWNTKPTRLACGACHDGIKWSDGTGTTLAGAATGHVGKGQSNDGTCALCHSAADIKTYHQTENITPHNPTIAAGLKTITYEIASASVDATTNAVTVKFKISADGTALTSLGTATVTAPTGFSGGPSFLLAWAETQDGITTPIDYNNTTRGQAQAISISISNLLKGTGGSIAGPDSSGYFTATLSGTAGTNVFPTTAKMRAVALQGYYSQTSSPGTTTAAIARHAVSVVKAVTGDTVRRTVVDKEKCANCHEWFEGHGGNRVKETQVCVMCHVPGLATSGRGATAAQLKAYSWSAASKKILTDWGINPATFGDNVDDALKYPVTTNNMKDMIHGIHAGRDRVTPFKDARNRGGNQTLLDFRRMDFPGRLNNCETCHVAGTYSNVSATALASTYESINAAYATTKTQANALASLNAPANATDTVTSPFAAACISCHDSVAAASHMATQGGMIQVTRATFAANIVTPGAGEACATCHGTGKSEDIAVKHK